MRFGFHLSISGGFSRVLERAKKRRCETIQIFTYNPRSWRFSPLPPQEVEKFKKDMEGADIHPLFAHMAYLPNLASPSLFRKSVNALKEEMKRAETLNIPFLIIHVGNCLEGDEDKSLEWVARGVNEVLEGSSEEVNILLENTAGQGSEIGYNFYHLSSIIRKVEYPERVGLCWDTAHALESGYDLTTSRGLEEALSELEEAVGLHKLQLIHLNDSKTPRGSRIDRHWHIGKGHIGMEAFRRIINHPLLKHLPAVMETPWGLGDDLMNMEVVESLKEK